MVGEPLPANNSIDLEVDGKTVRAIPRDVQFEPVRDFIVHVDFLRLGEKSRIALFIPVVYTNREKSPGLKRGGVLNIVRHELELICDANLIPDEIVIDVTGFDVGDSIHISHVKLPAGSESKITDRDFTIATIVAPSALKSSDGDTTVDGGAEA